MFLHAAKKIEGEEITVAYFDPLIPQPLREKMCELWGFKCNCRHCALEKSLDGVFKNLNGRFDHLHDRAVDETHKERSSGAEFPTYLPSCGKFAKVYESMEQQLLKYEGRLKEEERQWIQASYGTAYWAGTRSNEFFDRTLVEPIFPSGHEIQEAVVNTVPGDFRSLSMAASVLEGMKKWIDNEWWGAEYVATQARDACVGGWEIVAVGRAQASRGFTTGYFSVSLPKVPPCLSRSYSPVSHLIAFSE